jgi:hypothetical protein
VKPLNAADRIAETDMESGLWIGGRIVDRHLDDAPELLIAYREDEGIRYLDYVPITPRDRLLPEDLAVTILINSRVGYRAYKSVQDLGPTLDLSILPSGPLEVTTEADRAAVADLIARVASWPGFAASVASKVLHKKRPGLIPVLDNQAIFGAYLNPMWPDSPSSQDSVWAVNRIRLALDAITVDCRCSVIPSAQLVCDSVSRRW